MIRSLACGTAIAILVGGAAATAVDLPPASQVVNDRQNNVSISFARTGAKTIFIAQPPAVGALFVYVDGNRDGTWGYGPYDPANQARPTADLSFGKAQAGYLCAQHIFAAGAQDRDAVGVSSQCGAFPSQGSIEFGAPDVDGRVVTAYRIPDAELFGSLPDALIVFAVWDGSAFRRYFSLAAPLLLRR